MYFFRYLNHFGLWAKSRSFYLECAQCSAVAAYIFKLQIKISKVIDHRCYEGRHPNKALVASYLLLLLPTLVTRTPKGKEPEGIMPQAHTK